eukprot:scaffold39551_cov57-Phaeocystis_antarctica.AAC.4
MADLVYRRVEKSVDCSVQKLAQRGLRFDPAPQCAWISVTCPTSVKSDGSCRKLSRSFDALKPDTPTQVNDTPRHSIRSPPPLTPQWPS